MKPILYLDIGPMQENNYTGIPAVTAALANQMLGDAAIDARFFWDRYEIPSEVVQSLLKIRDGRYFRYQVRSGQHTLHMLKPRQDEAIALYPNVKGLCGVFRREAQIVHDFSTLLFPETHHPDTIRHHALTFLRDLHSNEITFCVSEATRTDLLSYFALDPATVHTVLNGVDEPLTHVEDMPLVHEPYVAVLGTLEPRKNLGLIFAWLEGYPRWAEHYRFVFMGRFGWGKSINEVLADYPRAAALYQQGRLHFTGYIDEYAKQVLLRNARLLLFPSLFEGFGLPVLEAMRLGTPVVCSYSSSIPEVAGDAGFYFDPFSANSLDQAMTAFEAAWQADGAGLRARLFEQAGRFGWPMFYRRIRDVLFPNLA